MFQGIDLYSDTQTRPTPAMRKAISEAIVGDEQMGEDPTTRKLEDKAAELLGFDRALFFPSATMANEIALKLHLKPGDEMIAYCTSHLLFAETGGPAIHAQAMTRPIYTQDGRFTAKDIENVYKGFAGPHFTQSKLLCVENTTNIGGGYAWPVSQLHEVLNAANDLNLKTHLDGARLFHAALATKTPVKELARPFTTAMICLSKGLGCPTGALLVFDEDRFDEVRRYKQLLGGAMRQSGILAAAGIYALDNHIDRLEEDHENAERLYRGLADIPGFEIEERGELATNMVNFRINNDRPTDFLRRCEENGLRFSQVAENRFRGVTHLDIQQADIDRAVEIVRKVF